MDKPICIVSETDWVPQDAIARLESVFDVQKGPFDAAALKHAMQNADGCLVGLDHMIDGDMLGSQTRFVASPTTGLNHVDLKRAESLGVEIISLKGETAFLESITATAELCWGLVLSLLRHIPAAIHSVEDGAWDRDRFRGQELKDATLGIIGYGRLGRKVAQYARAFDMKILAHSHHEDDGNVAFCSLEDLLQRSDIVCLHTDSRPENHHMIGKREFEAMKESAYFINTARGDLVDEDALLEALQRQAIAGAALDVIEQEFDAEHSSEALIEYAKTHDNLMITPHIGGVTRESQYKTTHFIVDKLLHWWEETHANG